MSDNLIRTAWQQIESVRRERDRSAELIRNCQEAIARSLELLRRVDGRLARDASARPDPALFASYSNEGKADVGETCQPKKTAGA